MLELFGELQREFGFASLFISHDLAVVDLLADRIAVLYRGKLVEEGTGVEVLGAPEGPVHAAAAGVAAGARPHRPGRTSRGTPPAPGGRVMRGAAHGFPIVLSDLTLEYPPHGASPAHVALHGLTLTIQPGEVLGLLGSAGSGKSTLAKVLSGVAFEPRTGDVRPVITGGEANVLGHRLRTLPRRKVHGSASTWATCRRMPRRPCRPIARSPRSSASRSSSATGATTAVRSRRGSRR